MARAFIASVPLAIVLVAALVVPLAVIPGTFGFDSWPSSRGARVTESQVRLPAPSVDVVAVRPRKVERRPVLVAAGPVPARPVPATTVALAVTPRRAPIAHVPTPSPQPDRHPAPSHPAPQPAPSQPAQPQQQPNKPSSGLLAGGNAPVAREAPQQQAPPPQPAPAPTPPPVAQPAPVERAVPSEPCHGHGQGHAHGHDGGEGGPHGDANSGD